jgi:hypothetical protein
MGIINQVQALIWKVIGQLPNPNLTWDKGVHPNDPDQPGHPNRIQHENKATDR